MKNKEFIKEVVIAIVIALVVTFGAEYISPTLSAEEESSVVKQLP